MGKLIFGFVFLILLFFLSTIKMERPRGGAGRPAGGKEPPSDPIISVSKHSYAKRTCKIVENERDDM